MPEGWLLALLLVVIILPGAVYAHRVFGEETDDG